MERYEYYLDYERNGAQVHERIENMSYMHNRAEMLSKEVGQVQATFNATRRKQVCTTVHTYENGREIRLDRYDNGEKVYSKTIRTN